MRVTLCVDALQPQLSGIGRYTWELCKGLARHPDVSKVQFYTGHSLVRDPTELLHDVRCTPLRGGRLRRALQRWRVEKALTYNLVHAPNYFLPVGADRGIITVHDLSVLRYPEMHPSDRVRAFDRLFASSLDRAVHVITDTETIRREVIQEFSISPDAVSAVPLGVDDRFRPERDAEVIKTLKSWGLTPGGYGLSVAAFEPRKKLAELICAWSRLRGPVRSRYPLVLAGAVGWENEALHEQIAAAEHQGWLKHLGFVAEQSLPALYAGARLFAYPSVYEGFGLPPVEAMASGAPVIVSDRSCLPEVCGGAARFIDPNDGDGFTAAIEETLCDDERRTSMIARGLERARFYNWDRCISETVAVYRKAWAASS